MCVPNGNFNHIEFMLHAVINSCIDETVVMPSAMGFLVIIPFTGQGKCYLRVCWVRVYVSAYLMVIALGFDASCKGRGVRM
jgi:hypothetical protein